MKDMNKETEAGISSYSLFNFELFLMCCHVARTRPVNPINSIKRPISRPVMKPRIGALPAATGFRYRVLKVSFDRVHSVISYIEDIVKDTKFGNSDAADPHAFLGLL